MGTRAGHVRSATRKPQSPGVWEKQGVPLGVSELQAAVQPLEGP